MVAPPSPLSSRPKRSEVEGSAVPRTTLGNVFPLVDTTSRVFQNHIGEYRSIGRLRKVRAKADAYVERSIEVQVNGRPELMHRFTFQAYEERKGVSSLFDANALSEHAYQAVRRGAAGAPAAAYTKLHIFDADILLRTLR